MPEAWTGVVVKKMHLNNISMKELAEETGCSYTWMSQVLNSHVNPPGTRQRVMGALNRLIERKGGTDEGS